MVLEAEKRIDLVRAGLLLSLSDALILRARAPGATTARGCSFPCVGWGAANGFLCGILTLGFLPVFELVLNAPDPVQAHGALGPELADLQADALPGARAPTPIPSAWRTSRRPPARQSAPTRCWRA